MKRKLLLFLIISLVIFLPSCASSTTTIQYAAGPPLKICTTISPIYSITADVVATREKVSVEQIIPPNKSIEEYNIGDEEYKYYSQFNLIVINGMGLDNEIAERLKNLNPKIKICDASVGIEPIINEKGEKNQKIWSSPLNQLIMYQNIANAVMEIDQMPVDSKDVKSKESTIKNNEAIIKEYQTRFSYIENLLKEDITVEKNIAPKADLQNLKANKSSSKKEQSQQDETVQVQEENQEENKDEDTNKLVIEEDTKNIILNKTKINTSKKAFTQDDSFDYLLRDCSIEKTTSPENSIELGSIETDNNANNKCLLKDIMKQKEIMPNTVEKTSEYNMKKLKLYFGENK